MYCEGKSPLQLAALFREARHLGRRHLLTRLGQEKYAELSPSVRRRLDYDPSSKTAFWGRPLPLGSPARVAIITAGTSDAGVAKEAQRTLVWAGIASTMISDVGAAGIWRVSKRLQEIREHPIVIVVAGMDAALPTVLGGLVGSVVIGVPTSVGYGIASGGFSALGAILGSCAPGILAVNIDNGYGAATAALRILSAARPMLKA